MDFEDDLIPNFPFISFLLMLLIYSSGYILMILAKNYVIMLDIEKTSASDYTLMISNLPPSCSDSEEMKKYITFVRSKIITG